jgi:methyl-accepting chemotaxis protein
MPESEKSLGKKLLGFFIKEEEANVSQPAPPPSAPAAKVPLPAQQPSVGAVNAAGTAEVNRKFVEHFVELLEKANLPGPDYFEFKQALKSMEGLGLSEEKQYQASWASFRAISGGVKDTTVLMTSASQYVGVLDRDRASFLKDVEKAINDRVGSLNQELNKLQEDNKTYARQIVELQEKINANNGRLEKINGEIQEQSAKINDNRDSYDITYHSMMEQINSDVAKINKYLL